MGNDMEQTEKAIRITAKLYETRDAARRLWGSEYQNRITPYRGYIKMAMDKFNLDETQATMKLVKQLQDKDAENGFGVMLIFAAYVEIMEPSQSCS
jgi:hypothetical protein